MIWGYLFLLFMALAVAGTIYYLIEWDEKRRENANYVATDLGESLHKLKTEWGKLRANLFKNKRGDK